MTQKEQILEMLNTGEHVTPFKALREFGCFRLAARICELRDEGHHIDMKLVSRKPGKVYAEYWKEF